MTRTSGPLELTDVGVSIWHIYFSLSDMQMSHQYWHYHYFLLTSYSQHIIDIMDQQYVIWAGNMVMKQKSDQDPYKLESLYIERKVYCWSY